MKLKQINPRKNMLPPPPLRRVREETGLKRGAFAQGIGCSYETVKKVESGAIPISPDVAILTMLAYGVRPESLIELSAFPVDLQGKKYSDKAYHLWKAKIPRDPQGAAEEIGQATDQLRVFLEVACRNGRLAAARALLGRFFWSATADLGIDVDYGRELSKAGVGERKNLASAAKAVSERLLESFRESRAAYKTYMREEFLEESRKLSRAKKLPASPAYHRLMKKVPNQVDAGVPAKRRRTKKRAGKL